VTFAGVNESPSRCDTLKFTQERLSMKDELSLNHSRWGCQYHVVWIPRYLLQVFKEMWGNVGTRVK
jgi:hypothetical protein